MNAPAGAPNAAGRGRVEVVVHLDSGAPEWACVYRSATVEQARAHAVRALAHRAYHERDDPKGIDGKVVHITSRGVAHDGTVFPPVTASHLVTRIKPVGFHTDRRQRDRRGDHV